MSMEHSDVHDTHQQENAILIIQREALHQDEVIRNKLREAGTVIDRER